MAASLLIIPVSAAESWSAYNALWFEVLHTFVRNGQTPIFFAPISKADLPKESWPECCDQVAWLRLDCADTVRLSRLQKRSWSEARINEALADAVEIRQQIELGVDTGRFSPTETANKILTWARAL